MYHNNLYNTLYTYHLLLFDSTETTRLMYSCMFYFEDYCIAGIEESSERFFFFSFLAFDYMALEFIRTSEVVGSSVLIWSAANQYV